MDFTVLTPPPCPPRRAGGACTPPGRPLRASLNTARVTRPAATADPSTTSPAAARTPPARALRVSLNPACVSRPSAAAAAAAKKPKRPELSGDENPTTKRPSVAGDGKVNKNALAGASKVGTVLLPCSRVDEARRLALANTTTRHRGAAAADHAGASTAPAPALKRNAAPADYEIAVHRPCSRGDETSRSLLDNTARLRLAVADGHAGAIVAPAPVMKWKARPASSEIAMRRPCSRGDGASRLPLGNTARLRVGAAAEGHVAPASAAKRKEAPSDSVPAKRRATPAPASAARASPSPPSSDSGATVRELLEKARTATDAIRRRELQRLKAASRRELDRVVRTVEFNDPFISPQDVLRLLLAANGEKINSEKVVSLAYARIQGKTALVNHFQNSSLTNEEKRCLPMLFDARHTENGCQVNGYKTLLDSTNISHRNGVLEGCDLPGNLTKGNFRQE